jgi:hypothetical protein
MPHPIKVKFIMNSEELDKFEMRCPRLGHQISFSYCRREGGNLPCSRAIQCWAALLPVEAFFRANIGEEAYTRCFELPLKPKMISLVELIEQAKRKEKAKQAT